MLQIWDYGTGKLIKDVPTDYSSSMVSCSGNEAFYINAHKDLRLLFFYFVNLCSLTCALISLSFFPPGLLCSVAGHRLHFSWRE